jgi:alpha-tubulin suppressor-like RCC1 family protein
MGVCHEKFTALLTETGEIWVFGTSENGVLGVERKKYYLQEEPRMINDIEPMRYLVCSAMCMMGIGKNGQLYGWGDNLYG